jgi:small-conductance mechanosensitive channel
MIEEFDAAQANRLPLLILIALGGVALAVGLEFALSRARRWAEVNGHQRTRVLLFALRRQPLVWTLILTVLALLSYGSPNVATLNTVIRFATWAGWIGLTVVLVRVGIGAAQLAVKSTDLASLSLLNGLLGAIGFIVVAIVVLTSLGLPVQGLLVAIGGSSFGLSLALQQPLSNLFSGVLLAASNRFSPGDYIKLNSGEEGYITDIDWFTTRIQQITNNMVVVPNAAMTSAIVINYHEPQKELVVLLTISVSYKADLSRVEQVTLEVANGVMAEVQGGVPAFECLVRFSEFADSAVRASVIMRGQEFVDQFLLKHELVKRLHARFREEDIAFGLPVRLVHVE